MDCETWTVEQWIIKQWIPGLTQCGSVVVQPVKEDVLNLLLYSAQFDGCRKVMHKAYVLSWIIRVCVHRSANFEAFK